MSFTKKKNYAFKGRDIIDVTYLVVVKQADRQASRILKMRSSVNGP